jgi:hypothetical protein
LLEEIVTYKSLAIVILSTWVPLIVFMSEDGTFWGLIGIVGVFAGLGIPYLIIYWKRTTKFQDMTNFLTRLILMQIDEKIAVLDDYILNAPNWQAKDVIQMTDRIVSDLTAISRIRNDISDDQRIRIRERLIRLTNILRKNNHDTAKIEAVTGLLN